MWRTRGGTYVLLFTLSKLFRTDQLYRRWANALSRSALPETLVSLSGVYTNQAWPQRASALEALAHTYLSSSAFAALEIGTWFGAGSTLVWARHLKPGSQLFLVDGWGEYISDADKSADTAYSAMDSVHHVAINSALKHAYEIEANKGGEIYVLRGKASRVCGFFKPRSFDFICIDGSHYYDEVNADISLAKILVKDGGVIAGDDLEVEPTQGRLELAKKNLHRDFIGDEVEGVSFHPGVLLAVHEQFPAVKINAGIWSVIKHGDNWTVPS